MDLIEIVENKAEHNTAKNAMFKLFAKGLIAFQRGHWTDAKNIFENLLKTYGFDGPTRFYLDRANAFELNPPENWKGFITLNSK